MANATPRGYIQDIKVKRAFLPHLYTASGLGIPDNNINKVNYCTRFLCLLILTQISDKYQLN